jgi:hypothetical protein
MARFDPWAVTLSVEAAVSAAIFRLAGGTPATTVTLGANIAKSRVTKMRFRARGRSLTTYRQSL